MRYHLHCQECIKIGKDNFFFETNVTPNNKGIYNVKCHNGHIFKIDVVLHHFQVLFENGIHALSDNYFIESFVSFSSSYERFIEFFIRVILISNGVKKSTFDETWKELAKQSERQLGAFFMIYLQEFDHKPKQISNKNKELRNKVIHKGYLPTKDDCIKYGNDVLNFIRSVVQLLKENSRFEKESIRSVNATYNFDVKGLNTHLHVYQIFAINRSHNETDKKKIEDFLSDISKSLN